MAPKSHLVYSSYQMFELQPDAYGNKALTELAKPQVDMDSQPASILSLRDEVKSVLGQPTLALDDPPQHQPEWDGGDRVLPHVSNPLLKVDEYVGQLRAMLQARCLNRSRIGS